MALLALLVRVLVLIRHGMWAQVGDVPVEAEAAFGEACPPSMDLVSTGDASPGSGSPTPGLPPAIMSSAPINTTSSTLGRHNNEASTDIDTKTKRAHLVLLIHLLVAGVVYHTYVGDTICASERLQRLHALLDAGVLSSKGARRGDGVLEVRLLLTSSLTAH